MSLMSLLLALSPPLAARFKPKPNRLAEALEAELAKAREEITELRRERDMWRNRAYEAVPTRVIPLRTQQLAQHISLLAQYQAQQVAPQSQIPPQYLLGAQNLNVLDEMFCNCVPARHDLLRG